jgi:hypothetical protein
MGMLRFVDLQSRPTEVLDLTSLTIAEFGPLVSLFETAFQAPMAACRLDGRPRTAGGTPLTKTVRCRRLRIGCC